MQGECLLSSKEKYPEEERKKIIVVSLSREYSIRQCASADNVCCACAYTRARTHAHTQHIKVFPHEA